MHLLLYPPFADPTQPYLSLPSLKGYLRSRSLDARVLDLNVEAAHHLFERETLEDIARRIGLRFLKLNRAQTCGVLLRRTERALLPLPLRLQPRGARGPAVEPRPPRGVRGRAPEPARGLLREAPR